MKVREALQEYLKNYTFGKTLGGYGDRWARVVIGKFVVWFPNFENRRQSVMRHDINHILTGYPAIELKGEMQIAYFELAAGCGKFWAAWFFNSLALVFALIWPKEAWRAFLRGRHALKSLYVDYEYNDALLEKSVEELRSELGI
jgi:ubiquinone biosynthesis protein Coq4